MARIIITALFLFALLPTACVESGRDAPASDPAIRLLDDTDHEVVLERPVSRVVSLIPAATEILFAIGRGDRLVGRTRYGLHPREAEAVPSVGGGVRPDPERVLARDPDLVVMFAGADNRSTIRKFRELEIPVMAVRHNDLEDLRRNIDRFGRVTAARTAADSLISSIRFELDSVARAAELMGGPVSVYYYLGSDPFYTIGGGSYLDSLLTIAGGRNIFSDMDQPSPVVGFESIVARRPECIIVGTPGPADGDRLAEFRARPGWSALSAVRAGRVVGVDADLVHRLGPRIGAAAAALQRALRRCVRVQAPGGG